MIHIAEFKVVAELVALTLLIVRAYTFDENGSRNVTESFLDNFVNLP